MSGGASPVPSGARAYLDSLAMHGIKLGLHNIEFLLRHAEHPQLRYPTVHVAGTNGKGSTIALLHAMLQAAGYRVGRFTSPHLIDLRERFQINGACISEAALEAQTEYFREAASELEHPPTFFELNTAIAFRWFAEQRVELALIEVGLGGRLDSTNVLQPLACAITSIDLEHTAYLGDTLEKIAGEKAGIIKQGVPVVVSETKPGPREVMLEQAQRQEAPVRLVDRDFNYIVAGSPWKQRFSYRSSALAFEGAPLALAGRHQGANAATATALAELLRDRFSKLDETAIQRGLEEARWPGRLERVLDHPPVILDAAHNAAGARRLAELFDEAVVVAAVASDKDAGAMLEALGNFAAPFILTQFAGARALPAHVLAQQARGDCEVIEDLEQAIARGMELASARKPLLITGSIFLGGEARGILVRKYGAKVPLF